LKYIAVSVNGGSKNQYIELFSGSTAGSAYDARAFYGDTTNTSDKSSNGFISISINASTYYIRKYSGDTASACSSNMVGTEDSASTFQSAGFILANINNAELDYIQIFTKVS